MIEYTPEEQARAWQALRRRELLRDYAETFDPEILKRDEFARALVRFECHHQRRLAEQRMRIPAVARRPLTPFQTSRRDLRALGIDLKRRASGERDEDND